jgi:hypothetical protein
MVKAPGILIVLAFYEVLDAGWVAGCLARFVTRVLQTKFLFAFDLHDLGVMHSDLHSPKAQIAQCALDLTQNGCFVLAINTT